MSDGVKATPSPLFLDPAVRDGLWERFARALGDYTDGVADLPVAPRVTAEGLRHDLAAWDFTKPVAPETVLDFTLAGMRAGQLHTPHPAYYGVFNANPSTLGVLGDAIAAGFNTQLASWTSAPFAIEVETHLLTQFGLRFGYPADSIEGTFTSGGTEANLTAILLALEAAFPAWREQGLRALPGRPVLYISTEGHHSFVKGARMAGLGNAAVREIQVGADLRMDTAALSAAIAADRARGDVPFLVVGTAGSTNGGTVDDLAAIGRIARAENLWFHADAAWGGAAILVPELAPILDGIAGADSITLDAHKWLSVPMTAGLFLTHRRGALEKTFRVGHTVYMPKESLTTADTVHQPYAQSLTWSRRFRGLKLFLTLAAAGWDGYAEVLRHQTAMGALLRKRLEESGWECLNPTPLPVACFVDSRHARGREAAYHEAIARHVGQSGRSWVTTTSLSGKGPTLRAGIANFRTMPPDIETLIAALEAARAATTAA